ncbi:MAG: formate dehydrogenase accessory sulfurtransferase FdhD [Elusimicrobia bacterium]|nr:formate dehydrogenase accessory sulfurtransferase FdhD [Elusimicrobiota bacterium]
MKNFEIIIFRDQRKIKKNDWITEEIPLTINLNEKELVTLLCSPMDLKELVFGFLFTSGFIKGKTDVKNLIINQERWRANVDVVNENITEKLFFKRLYTSGCGKGVIYYNPLDLIQRMRIPLTLTIKGEEIISLLKEFQRSSDEFKKTGAVHSAALCNQEKIIILKDDIGRHNAIDKIIGAAILADINFEDKIILTSGRISSEILLKTNRCKIPLIASGSAPTNQAVKFARELNITLIGFIRGNRMNIYSGEERIK